MRQFPTSLIMLLTSISATSASDNLIFDQIQAEGLAIEGTTVRLPSPSLADGQNSEATKAILRTIAGDDRGIDEFLRDSVTAPIVLRNRDVIAGDTTVRVVDLWFAVHARLDEVDLEQTLRQKDDQAVEAGNMKFSSKFLSDQELVQRKILPLPHLEGRKEWWTHLSGRLLDRIQVEVTDHAVATRTSGSLLIASRTDLAFDADSRFPNRWVSLSRKGVEEIAGPSRVYQGSVSYLKITPLAGHADTLLVESHLAYAEPRDWFQGNPILRSKIGVVSQDQIRRLRREIQKNRTDPKRKP